MRSPAHALRAVLPSDVRASLGLKGREVRVSLRTKDKRQAKRACLLKHLIMDDYFQYPAPWEIEAEQRKHRYLKGLRLLRSYGPIDLNDEFAVDALADDGVDLEAYIFALEYARAKERRVKETGRPPADSTPPILAPLPPAPPVAPPPAQPQIGGKASRAAATAGPSDEFVEAALRRFVEAKRLSTRASTADKYGDQCRLFLKIIAECDASRHRMSDITPQTVRCYADTLPRLPAKVRLADPRSIADILASATQPMAPKTRFSHAQAVNMFLTFCQDQQYPTPGGFGGILKPLLKKPALNKAEQNQRAFTNEELQRLFLSRPYRDGTHKRPSDYWVPLLDTAMPPKVRGSGPIRRGLILTPSMTPSAGSDMISTSASSSLMAGQNRAVEARIASSATRGGNAVVAESNHERQPRYQCSYTSAALWLDH